MYRILCFLGVLVVLALAACDGATAPDLIGDTVGGRAADAALGQPEYGHSTGLATRSITLRLGQTLAFGETATFLTFNAVASDSRCPANLDCVEAGEALARFTFRRGDGAEYAVGIVIPGGSPLELSPEEVAPTFAGGYAFRLVRLQPYPGYAPDYSTSAETPVTATVVVEPCVERCNEFYPSPVHP
jgi:hypothetical protein